ncbi:MAG: NAD(P)H-hydrate dehydratase [Alphaproteobacteria bacterium]
MAPVPADAALCAVLTCDEMGRADRFAIDGGVAGIELMEAAGRAVARAIRERWQRQATIVLCGPGNNGGDGFVIARLLHEQGWPVRVALLGERAALKGDAAANARRWTGVLEPMSERSLDGAGLIVDAMFGAGLARPLDGIAKTVVEAIIARAIDCVAVDVPSGVAGDTGVVHGAAPQAKLTVTFFRKKPAHLLLPGRSLCGEIVVADIGIPAQAIDAISPKTYENAPPLWHSVWRRPDLLDHKYTRGHAIVAGGTRMTGAARLAARAALRAGAGMVTIAAPPGRADFYAATTAAVIVAPIERLADFRMLIDDRRVKSVLVGPGAGRSNDTRGLVMATLGARKPAVIDADGLTVFEGAADSLRDLIRAPVVLTPHDGEYARLFDFAGTRLERARAAAKFVGAVVLLKGGDTVIAAPDGRAGINANAPADLATAGAGDVLAGICVGLLAQGMPPFEAACAAAWLHGAAGSAVGSGLIADDLPDALLAVMRNLH